MEHIDNPTKMMSGSLGLEEPWYVMGAGFDEKGLALHIHVGVRKAAAIVCPKCGGGRQSETVTNRKSVCGGMAT